MVQKLCSSVYSPTNGLGCDCRFLWDFESSKDENVFGMFSSHGALLVANSEKSLEVHDVENGWDWAKVPGATTIAIGTPDVDELKLKKARFYNPRPLAGRGDV